MSKTCILLGDRSDIAKALLPYLVADGYSVHGWNRDSSSMPWQQWDLIICAIGQVAPVGMWHEQHWHDFEECIHANVTRPVNLLRELWGKRTPGASVCFMAGSNPQKIMDGYLGYNLSKMALLKAVEQIDHESPDCKVFALGVGYVKTKIHKATLDANWPNERIARGDDGTPIDRIWGCLKWCVDAPKKSVGGRNVCVSDNWAAPRVDQFLADQPDFWKLRRVE